MNVAANNLGADRWYATDGIVHLGPVPFDALARDLAHSHRPDYCHVRHETWQFWHRLSEMLTLSRPDRQSRVSVLAELSQAVSPRAKVMAGHDLPHENERLSSHTAGEPAPRTGIRPTMVDPVGVLSSADSLDSALLITLCTAVTASVAQVGLLHQPARDGRTLVTSGAQGTKAETLLGSRLSPDDPSVAVARRGHTLIAEPVPGDTGKPIVERLARCIQRPLGSAMVPLVLDDQLVAMFDLGRDRPFSAREIGRVEEVIQALVERSVFAGWLD